LTTNSLTLPTIGDVEDTIQGKQDTIQDNDLTIAKTSGFQTALDINTMIQVEQLTEM